MCFLDKNKQKHLKIMVNKNRAPRRQLTPQVAQIQVEVGEIDLRHLGRESLTTTTTIFMQAVFVQLVFFFFFMTIFINYKFGMKVWMSFFHICSGSKKNDVAMTLVGK